ncbi:MAG: tyrosine-type recombinase/integrase [Bacteroidota bacterium]|nr:tyrosine-type recombinase/integrase [Bacteroidota bacterium]
MATVRAFIRTKKNQDEGVNVRFRLSDGRDVQLHYVSDILVQPKKWDNSRQIIKPKVLCPDDYRNEINGRVAECKRNLLSVYDAIKDDPTPERWYKEIENRKNPPKPKVKGFFDYFDEFIKEQPAAQRVHLKVLKRCLQRWELYTRTFDHDFKLEVGKLNGKDVKAFDEFLKKEHAIQDDYPRIYEQIKETRRVKPRGNNARVNILNRLRMFYRYCVKQKITANNPFDEYKVNNAVYGTPYFITLDELDHLYHADLSNHPETAVQRDIFVFQSLIGCRVSDLSKLTRSNVKGDFLEYVQQKTRTKEPKTVRVPLAGRAKELVEKYQSDDNRLFPFISDQKYNKQIKKAFKLAGLTRLVTVLNPTTGEEEQRPLNEIASSHLARRTFIGNLYSKVQDPNLIASMSGHEEGSRAFSRYRKIDDELKQEIIKLLENQ